MVNENQKKISRLFILFIAIQPLLDVLTTWSIRELETDITIGIVIRLIAMVLGGVFLLLNYKGLTKHKVLYLVLLAIVLVGGLVNNLFVKESFNFMTELQSVGKDVYSIVMLFVYLAVFKILLKNKTYFPEVIVAATMLINIVMIVSIATGTSLDTYRYLKFGLKGWFYAANELGTILAMTYPIVIYFTIKKVDSLKKLWWWLLVTFTIFSMLIIGTKVGYGAVLIVLPIASGSVAFEAMRKKKMTKVAIANFVMPIIFMGLTIVLTPYLSISSNTESHIELVNQYNESVRPPEEVDEDEEVLEEPITEEESQERDMLTELIFSGRNQFLNQYIRDFEEAPLSQKLFGLGFGANYMNRPKVIERDFHDFFFHYGIVGFILTMLPFAYYIGKSLIMVFRNFINIFTVKFMMLGSSLALGLGVAYIAGHALTAPGVSIYLVSVLSYLYYELVDLDSRLKIHSRKGKLNE